MIKKVQFNRGFTLFEMLVVIAIAVFMTAMTFSNFPKMNSKLSLDLLTQDIALTMRQAQIYGTTVLGGGGASDQGGVFSAYGVGFPPPGNDYSYVIFADLDPVSSQSYLLNRYDESYQVCALNREACFPEGGFLPSCGDPTVIANKGSNECLQRYFVKGRDQVSRICPNYYVESSEIDTKNKRIVNCRENSPDNCFADIVYRRPKLQATITVQCEGQNTPEDLTEGNVGVVLESEGGETRTVVVWENGQISIDR